MVNNKMYHQNKKIYYKAYSTCRLDLLNAFLTILESPCIHICVHTHIQKTQLLVLIITMWAKYVSTSTLTTQETIK